MSRVTIEYAKAAAAASCAALLLALGIVEHTVDAAGLTIASGALSVAFVTRARAFGRIAGRRRGCNTPATPRH